MTPNDIQQALRGPLIANVGNKLTAELIAGLLVTLSDAVVRQLAAPAVNAAADAAGEGHVGS